MKEKVKTKYEDIETKISSYFDYCDAVNDEKNKIVKPYTLSGLLCYIGMSREEFDRLSKIKRHEKLFSSARARIEAFIEENALVSSLSCNASLNSLKYNFGWGERSGDEKSDTSKNITVTLSPDIIELAR